jgi:hypothetical protein
MLQLIVQSNIPAGHMGVITFTTQSAYMSACTNQLFSLTWRYTCYSILPIHNEQWAAWNAWMHPVSATHPIRPYCKGLQVPDFCSARCMHPTTFLVCVLAHWPLLRLLFLWMAGMAEIERFALLGMHLDVDHNNFSQNFYTFYFNCLNYVS